MKNNLGSSDVPQELLRNKTSAYNLSYTPQPPPIKYSASKRLNNHSIKATSPSLTGFGFNSKKLNQNEQLSEFLKNDKQMHLRDNLYSRDLSNAFDSYNEDLYYYPSFIGMSKFPDQRLNCYTSLQDSSLYKHSTINKGHSQQKLMGRHLASIYKSVIIMDTPKAVQEMCESVYKSKF